MKKFVIMLAAFALVFSLAGCVMGKNGNGAGITTGPDQGFVPGTETTSPTQGGTDGDTTNPTEETIEGTTPATTIPEGTVPDGTDPEGTTPEGTADPTDPVMNPTEPQVKPTDPKPTDPKPTEPKPTEPKPTEPPHTHSYEAKTVNPTCSGKGYTQYTCTTCGKTYKDNYKDALGHNMKETDRKEATTTEEGYITYTCANCGKTETTKIEKVKEVLDLRALEEYGRQYAVSEHGYQVEIGLRAGYYPGILEEITSMEDGKQDVAEAVNATTRQLIALCNGRPIATELPDGTVLRARIDIEIVHEFDDYYRIWVYYG